MATIFRKSCFSNLEFGFSVVLGNNNSNNKPTTTSKSKIAKPRRGSLDNIKLGGGGGERVAMGDYEF